MNKFFQKFTFYKKDDKLRTYDAANYSMMAIASIFALIFLLYVISEISAHDRLNKALTQINQLTQIAHKLHKERAMQALLYSQANVDHQNIEILRIDSNKAMRELNSLNNALDKLFNIRNDLDQNRSDFNAELFSRYDEIDKEIFQSVQSLNSYTNDIEQTVPVLVMMSVFKDIIELDKKRDFLIGYIIKNQALDKTGNEILSFMLKQKRDYSNIIAHSPAGISHIFAIYKGDNDKLKNAIKKIDENKDYILAHENLDKLYFALLRGEKPDFGFEEFFNFTNTIENNYNSKIYAISADLQNNIKQSNNLLFTYLLIAIGVIIYIIFMLWLFISNKTNIKKQIQLLSEYKKRLQTIATNHNIAMDSKQIFELFDETANKILDKDNAKKMDEKEHKTFLSNISFEIKEPLNVRMGYNEILRTELANTEHKDLLKYLEEMDDSSNKLLKLLNNLIIISKLQCETIKIKNTKFSILDLPFNLVGQFSKKISSKNIELLIFVDPNLEGILDADKEKIEFILTSLLDNAIEYSIGDGSAVLLQISKLNQTKDDKTGIKFAVVDGGSGIKHEIIFEGFTDTNASKLQIYNSGGLDLRLCNQYLQMLGSKFDITSKANTGTKIGFSIEAKFKSDFRYKNKFQGEEVVIYSADNIYETKLPNLDGEKLPSFFDIVKSYLSHLGLAYKLRDTYLSKSVYIVRGTKKPFDDAKTILISAKQPEFTDAYTIWLKEPVSLSEFINAYEKITGKKTSSSLTKRINLSVLVLGDAIISSTLGELVSHVHTQINPLLHYDVVFVDLDLMDKQNIDAIQRPCSFIAISDRSDNLVNNKLVFDDYLLKADYDSVQGKELLKSRISQILTKRKQNAMLANDKLRDILIFKKSAAANNIYASAFRNFSDKIDTARNMVNLGEHLSARPYKIVICDADMSELNTRTYLEIINSARKKHNYDIIAGLFIDNDFRIESSLANEFELFSTSLNKLQYELKLKPILEGKR